MSSSKPFRFKKFEVHQDKCAFKIGTDSVILGSWTQPVEGNILDVGTGSGVLALMMAQKTSKSKITAIDIDLEQINQAKQNFKISPWQKRLRAVHADFKHLEPTTKFDLIITNPPYFAEGMKKKDTRLKNARHQDSLNIEQLISKSAEILKENGKLSLIIPHSIAGKCLSEALGNSLYLTERMSIHSKSNSLPIRDCLTFIKSNSPQKAEFTQLTIYEKGKLTPQFIELTKDYYFGF